MQVDRGAGFLNHSSTACVEALFIMPSCRWTGKQASSIDGKKIDFITVGSRTSAYVPSLQKIVKGSGLRCVSMQVWSAHALGLHVLDGSILKCVESP